MKAYKIKKEVKWQNLLKIPKELSKDVQNQ